MAFDKLNLFGAILAVVIISSVILIFIFRLLNLPKVEYWIGAVLMLSILPLFYLLLTASGLNRPSIYYLQLILMILFLFLELLLDYVLKIEFRQTRWMVITYVMIFFAGTGGMIGVASLAGKGWMICTVILFLTMAILAFYQRAKTGM